jgi:long-chain acyl-CoA synthetase
MMTPTDLWNAFNETVDRRGDAAAFICGDRTWTFADWRRRTDVYRAAFRSHGVERHDRVLLWVENDFEIAAAMTAAWASEASPALLDSGSRAPQLDNAIRTAQPRLLVRLADSALPLPDIAVAQVVAENLDAAPVLAGVSSSVRTVPTDPGSIVFTSGSTGLPKGVVQSHGNLVRGCAAVGTYLGLRPDDILLCPVPWSFDYGYGQLLSTIVMGITQVLPVAYNPFGICQAIEQHRPTVLAGLPALYTYLMGGLSPIKTTDRSSLRLLTNTGGAVPAPVLRSMREIFADAEIVLNYGLTETYRSCYVPRGVTYAPGLLGVAIPGADIVIVREDGAIAGAGEEGEIVHRGDYVCLGYWNNPEATARSVRPDPLAPPGAPFAGRAVYTGDYGRKDQQGLIYYHGRRDHLLKSMGIRVSPGEVEHLLYESGVVESVAVFGLPHDLLGHEVWAAVALKAGIDGGREHLNRYAREVMTPAMLPRRYIFKDALPRTTTGKIDYPALRDEALGRSADA